MDSLAQRVRAERKAAGLSQKALGDVIGVSKQAISSLERGESKGLKGNSLDRLSRELKINTHWLLTGRGPKALVTSQSVVLDPAILTATFNTISRLLTEDGRFFDMARYADAFAMVYAEGGELGPEDLDRLRKLLGFKGGGMDERRETGGASQEASGNGDRAKTVG